MTRKMRQGFRLAIRNRFLLMLLCILGGESFGEDANVASSRPVVDAEMLVAIACTQCHSLRPIENLRDGTNGWRSIVQEMILRGAQLSAAEEDTVVGYLARKYGPGSQPAMTTGVLPPGAVVSETETPTSSGQISLPAGAGMELVNGRCQFCHDLGRVVSVRRSDVVWRSIVENMSYRGIPASAEEIRAMTSYLVIHFGKSDR